MLTAAAQLRKACWSFEPYARLTPDGVRMPEGFRAAYEQYVAAGWTQLNIDSEWGGQGMPIALGLAVEEMMFSANMGFSLAPSLARGAIEAIITCGSDAQKSDFLPRLVSGEWTGTMNLTEPQAGSDLALLKTRAVARNDAEYGDHYRIYGQKIFISYGDHDLADNILHLVLARLDDAPAGVKGISMFLVPKYLPSADGGARKLNDIRVLSIEHKMGIHASPTCVMAYGEHDGAVGYLAGEAHHGLEYMFIMMNAARLSVGVQGISQAERACQQARAWARNRIQGRPPGSQPGQALPIIHHPDVKRMLLSMKAQTEAMRALAYTAAMWLDRGRHDADPAQRAASLARGEFMIPVVKGWCTETAIDVASTGVQVHGGMGYIEETGAAQTLRDVRIAAIYEGTTAIQSNDLVGRKLARDRGAALESLVSDLLAELNALRTNDPASRVAKNAAIESVTLLRDAAETLLQSYQQDPARALAVSVPFLQMCGTVLGGALMARSAAIAANALASTAEGGSEREFYEAKLQTVRFYAEQVLPGAHALARVVKNGAASVMDADAKLI